MNDMDVSQPVTPVGVLNSRAAQQKMVYDSVTWYVTSHIVSRDTHLCVGVLSCTSSILTSYSAYWQWPSFDSSLQNHPPLGFLISPTGAGGTVVFIQFGSQVPKPSENLKKMY